MMSITYKTKITQLIRELDIDTLQDVLIAAKYEIHATNERGVSVSSGDIVGLNSPDPENFTPYTELTEEQVGNWVNEALAISGDLDRIKQDLTITLNESVICSDEPSWLNS